MITQATALPGIAVTPTELDIDPWLLNCQNGTLDLRTGKVREHRREDLITKVTRVAYDPDAKCALWETFLARVQPDARVRDFLGRLAGYALTGDVGEHVLPIHHGKGRNGKGVFVNTRLYAMGDYAKQIPTELLMQKKGDAHPTEKTVLFGCRFAAAVESEEGRSLNVSFVKQATGGDKISARRMREDFWEFDPSHKIELSTNHRPVIRETADAIWERVQLVPWAVQIPKPERDKKLDQKLKVEAPGILAWMVRHCLAWQRDGLVVPECVRVATSAYRAAEDLFGIFLDECCAVEERAVIDATSIQEAYKTWDERELSHKALSAKLEERSFAKGGRDSKTGRTLWCGLRLREHAAAAQPGATVAYEGVSGDELDGLFKDMEEGVPEPSEPSEPRSGITPHESSVSSSTPDLVRKVQKVQAPPPAHDSSVGNDGTSPARAESPANAARTVPGAATSPPDSSPPSPNPNLEGEVVDSGPVLDPTLPHGERSVRVVRGFADTGRLELDVAVGTDGEVTRLPHDTPYRGDDLEAYVAAIIDERQVTVAMFEQRAHEYGVGCHIVSLRRPSSPSREETQP
jgi:putative DNA primase/helicase